MRSSPLTKFFLIAYLVVLTDPTSGGVFASFAGIGDIMLAEPKALLADMGAGM